MWETTYELSINGEVDQEGLSEEELQHEIRVYLSMGFKRDQLTQRIEE
jgi:hypothetical protein